MDALQQQAAPIEADSDYSDEDGKNKSRKRSTKACDNCRKSKCKCRPKYDADGNLEAACENCSQARVQCTYEHASRKRGPPKGYLTCIESRLHKLEALLGGILSNDDPRAVQLLGELIGEDEAHAVLSEKTGMTSSIAKADPNFGTAAASRSLPGSSLMGATGISPALTFSNASMPHASWFSDDELRGTAGPSTGTDAAFQQYRKRESDTESSPANISVPSPGISGAIDMPTSAASAGGMLVGSGPSSLSRSIPQVQNLVNAETGANSSPRQRRKLAHQSPRMPSTSLPATSVPASVTATSAATGMPAVRGGKQNPFNFVNHSSSFLPHGVIGHTGAATYRLSGDGGDAPPPPPPPSAPAPAAGRAASRGRGSTASQEQQQTNDGAVMTELADVVGQLSLNENAEVRYHGRSSGLYLLSKSQRYKDFFWQFPSAGVWPPSDGRVIKTEAEILKLSDAEDPLPDRETQQHLLDLYWTYVHPHFPILYKVAFMRQYRHSLSNPNSTEPSTPGMSGKVPIVLLLAMFALAARYSDLDPPRADGKYWTAGQAYMEKARRILNHDYGSSRLVTVQALLLLAYREIGTGAMSSSWLYTGMAIRMAQDLGLFRDVEKWFLPVQRFTHEEKQTRKRVWWGCLIMDKYTASYIGRPGTIHERDYDTSFVSEDEPEEHEQWRPLRPDGTDWSRPPKVEMDEDPVQRSGANRFAPTKAHALSCFNAMSALSVIINRIIINVYALRVRVMGQSSETLLSLLDQSLASWYLALPQELAYNPTNKKVPAPHVLCLHMQFYCALILLHRPFIPAPNARIQSPSDFPSHSICTTSANAIASIVTTFSKTFTLRQCPPLLTYPIFSAAIICVYNAGFDELARPAKTNLLKCMNALKEMEVIWGSATRQYELLHGLVDLADTGLNGELDESPETSIKREEDDVRGTKRRAEQDTSARPPLPRQSSSSRNTARSGSLNRGSTGTRRRKSSASKPATSTAPDTSSHRQSFAAASPSIPEHTSLFAEPQQQMQTQISTSMPSEPTFTFDHQSLFQHMPPPATTSSALAANATATAALGTAAGNSLGMFAHSPPPFQPAFGMAPDGSHHQSFNILGNEGPIADLPDHLRSRPGSSSGNNFTDLLNSFLTPTEAATDSMFASRMGNLSNAPTPSGTGSTPSSTQAPPRDMSGLAVMNHGFSSLDYGLGGGMGMIGLPMPSGDTSSPHGAHPVADDWRTFLPPNFFSPGSQPGFGFSPDAAGANAAPGGSDQQPQPPTS